MSIEEFFLLHAKLIHNHILYSVLSEREEKDEPVKQIFTLVLIGKLKEIFEAGKKFSLVFHFQYFLYRHKTIFWKRSDDLS